MSFLQTVASFWRWLTWRRFGISAGVSSAIAIGGQAWHLLPGEQSPATATVISVLLGIATLGVYTSYHLLSRLQELESDLVPQLTISGPIETLKPGDQGLSSRRFSLRVTNTSSQKIHGVQLKQVTFMNREGKQSNQLGARFSWAVQRSNNVGDQDYLQTIWIAANDSEDFDIAMLDESHPGTPVMMLYASPANSTYANSIPRKFFPHELSILLTADGLAKPIQTNFTLLIDAFGSLQMKERS